MTAAQRIAGRILLAVVGLGIITYLVLSTGPALVADTLWGARSWLPVIIALELVQLVSDVVTLRLQLGEHARDVPAATWVRSSALAYAMMICVPAGRAAGEVARAALVAQDVGTARAAVASTQLQAAYVFAIAVLSGVETAVVADHLGPRAPLTLLLAGNAVLMTAVSVAVVTLLRAAPVGRWLERIRRMVSATSVPASSSPVDTPRGFPWRGAVVCICARSAQALQYGVILHAVGGAASAHGALIAHGIELVGATLGDFFPNQVGVVDGAYRTFAADVGFRDAPARALSIALLARLARLLIAAGCVAVLAVTRSAAKSLDARADRAERATLS